jgi:rubrerythrin
MMKVDFSGDEIQIYDFDELESYRVARKMEEDGIYYYSRVKDEVLRPEIRNVIEMLIADEKKHLGLFQDKIDELAKERQIIDEGDTLTDIVDSKVMDVLKDSARVADILCNPQEAVRLGLAVESRSVAFYERILENTEDKRGRAALEQLIQEEKEHISKLKGLLRK